MVWCEIKIYYRYVKCKALSARRRTHRVSKELNKLNKLNRLLVMRKHINLILLDNRNNSKDKIFKLKKTQLNCSKENSREKFQSQMLKMLAHTKH